MVKNAPNSGSWPNSDFWRGKRVLLTGHTGFKGSWLLEWLEVMGAKVFGLALPPEGPVNLFSRLHGLDRLDGEIADLRDVEAVRRVVAAARPEIVFHMAAQSLVRRGYADPAATFAVNIGGTHNVLEALKMVGTAQAIVVTTTDKVYRNSGTGRAFVETDPLGGTDPYSESKALCEMVVSGYRAQFDLAGCGIATARAGNVIGGGDWSDDRLIPDAIRAWGRGEALEVRRPDATRPWQHVLEPLRGYMVLAENLAKGRELASAYNFGPREKSASVREVLVEIASHFDHAKFHFAETIEGPHEAPTLSLDPTLAANHLGVRPIWQFEETIARTARWYRSFHDGADPVKLCMADRLAFLKAGQVAVEKKVRVA